MLRKNHFKNKKIIVGVTGGIAAYKIPQLVRLLKKEGAEVQVVVTEAAKSFVTPQTLSVLSENPVLSDFFKNSQGEWNNHVHLALWADAIVIAPAGAHTLAKMAHGLCDNLLMSVILSSRCPVWVAPAMDLDMWTHASTQANIKTLTSQGINIIDPVDGELASGLSGKGRMAEPEQIFAVLESQLLPAPNYFTGKRVLVTAGGTQESIDPVRFIGNHSSGKMGFAIADALVQSGATVDIVYGSVSVALPENCAVYPTPSAKEMHTKCLALFPQCDILIMAAAVADFAPAEIASQKIKKSEDSITLTLKKNPDILSDLSGNKRQNQITIGFALETENENNNALGKLQKKNLDCIVLNSQNNPEAGFGVDTNAVTVFCNDGKQWQIPTASKTEVAAKLLQSLSEWLTQTH
ncbi:MAG: bifunctional phosphopantothenoylcysteine decarboxylase/phosphopantothenate--cysteine ligase CoaBC [Bacteroidota bacterium]|jgi:phosphopantothenoylcysteine decarboxylase/phosphopantothenate--cysteine ligase